MLNTATPTGQLGGVIEGNQTVENAPSPHPLSKPSPSSSLAAVNPLAAIVIWFLMLVLYLLCQLAIISALIRVMLKPNRTKPNRFNRFAPAALANHRARSGHRYIYMCICVYTYLLLWGYAEGVCCTCRQPFINKYCTFKFSIWRPISDKGIRHNNNWACSLICPEISIVHWCRVWFLVLNCACVGGGDCLKDACKSANCLQLGNLKFDKRPSTLNAAKLLILQLQVKSNCRKMHEHILRIAINL